MQAHVAMSAAFHYSVDLPIQTYTERVPLKCGKLAAKIIRGYTDIFTVYRCRGHGGGDLLVVMSR